MQFLTWVERIWGFIFGRFCWSPPPWLKWIFGCFLSIFRCLKARPRQTAIVAVILIGLGLGSWQTWRWWEAHKPRELAYNQVRQVTVSVSQSPAAITPGAADENLTPSPLDIFFSGAPVAPLEKIGKDANDAVTLEPSVAGKWTWRDGSTLRFQPASHWPANLKLTATIKPAALAKDLKLNIEEVTATTPPLNIQTKDFAFYNSPQDPAVYQVVGTVKSSHPLRLEDLQNQVRMEVVGGTPVFSPGNPLFTVKADPLSSRTFYIRSRQILVPLKEDWVKLTVPKGLASPLGGEALTKDQSIKTRVPDKYSGLKIEGIETRIIRTDDGEPQQFLFVTTNLDIDSAEISKRIHMWWRQQSWHDSNGKLDFEAKVATATKVVLTPVESEAPISKQHSFRFTEARTQGQMLLRISKGAKSPGGFEINSLFERTLSAPAFPKESRILGKGNVLALDGERKLIVQSRGIKHLRITLSRVPDSQFQHLITLTGSSSFDQPQFSSGFSENNIVQRWSKVVAVPYTNDWEALQSVIDLAEAPPLAKPDPLAGGRGVFFVNVEPVIAPTPPEPNNNIYSRIESTSDYDSEQAGHWIWYDEGSEPNDGWLRGEGTSDKRFVMVTDLGLLLKVAADGSRDVFVMSLADGKPVSRVEIRALARNGSILESTQTDSNGQAKISSLEKFKGEQMPVAIVAVKGDDTSFLPFNERQLPAMNYSRFDIDGVLASRIKAIEAFVFTERGVYRPGDTVHSGFIIRRRDWQAVIEGLPLSVSITDPRGRTVGSEKTRLSYDGFFTCDFKLSDGAALGAHEIEVSVLDKHGDPMFRLGRAAVRVEEFQPDRMKVKAEIDSQVDAGWLDCRQTDASVTVQSLFDEAAPERRVTMKLELSPARFGFDEWKDYTFYDRSATQSSSLAGRSIDLGETKTNEKGVAVFHLPLDTLKNASFSLSVLTEAFERDGGRSVRHSMTRLVSPFGSVIGWKSDNNLNNLTKDSGCEIQMLAIGRDLKPLAIDNLRRRLIEIRQVSVLTQLDNGNYSYVSTAKEQRVSEEPLSLNAGPNAYTIPTAQAGRFRMEILDLDGAVLCAVPFEVAGKGNTQASLEREAELSLQLSKNEVLPGEEIEVFLTAPYAGAGLVTIERDRVFTSEWFKTDTKATSIRVKIPKDAEGTYYINAAFIRSTDAPEVFHSPLSYAAAPIRVVALKKQLKINLETPKEVRPGAIARFGISSDRPARVVLYAVDEGIHQITSYKLPDPLGFFLRKQALEVRTQQWLDLLLPEYRFLKAASAFGGGGNADDALIALHINPFKRRQEPPVVFWSGIIDTSPDRKEVTWQVPDYFNGNLKVMAVGCQAEAIGNAESSTLVKAPIILQPNAPLFVTPGDEFEASLSVFNHLEAKGVTPIEITVVPDEHLEIIGDATRSLPLEQGREESVRFRFRAKDALGGAEIRFLAKGAGETIPRSTTLSVRPASHHKTDVVTGWFRTGSTEQKVTRTLYPQFRHTEAVASVTPLGLARGLESYVSEYPYGCSEQITSRAMVKLVASTEADFGLSPQAASDAVRRAISLLTSRQRADGGFGYWYADASSSYEFHSLYVLHFLTEAKLTGHTIPDELLKDALKYAASTARENTRNAYDAEIQSYAIYLLARNGENPSAQLLNLRDTLDEKFKGTWEDRPTAAWMAATYMLLKKDDQGNKLLDACLNAKRKGQSKRPAYSWNYSATPEIADLQIFYIQCRHFPERAKSFGIEALEPIMKPLRDQSFNTLACSYMTLALKAYSDLARSTGLEVSIARIAISKPEPARIAGPSSGILRTSFDANTAALRFERNQKGSGDIGAFYQVTEQGYDSGPLGKADRSGLEVSREITPVKKGEPLRPGDPVDVVLRVRNVTSRNLENLAVVDLLPAGFEVLAGDLHSGARTVNGTEFAELREDRTLFFLGLEANGEWSVKYRMKAVCPGSFVVPAALAEDMYDRGLHGTSTTGRIEIAPAK